MDKYINADKVLADNAELADCDFNHPKYEDTLRDIIDRAPTANVIPLDRIKEAREEIKAYYEYATDEKQKIAFDACLIVLDKLIAEYIPAKSDPDLQEEQEEER